MNCHLSNFFARPNRMFRSIVISKFVFLVVLFGALSTSQAQKLAPAVAAVQDSVELNFPEQMDLKVLIEYVSRRAGVKILYDEQVASKKITIKAPGKVPASTLLEVLQSALKIKGLALIDADVEGWKQIIVNRDLTLVADPTAKRHTDVTGGAQAVTQTFKLKHVQPAKISVAIKPFLTEPGSNVITIAEQNLLIITDYAKNLSRISDLIETIDQAGPPSTVKFYQAKHVEASELARQIVQTGSARSSRETSSQKIEALFDERTNKLILVGTEAMTNEAIKFVETLDVPLQVTTTSYRLRFVAADRIDNLVQELIDPLTRSRSYRSAIDTESNVLVVTAPPEVHKRIQMLADRLDVEGERTGSSVEFYKLKHADAGEILQTLTAIQQGNSGVNTSGALAGGNGARGVSTFGRGAAGSDTRQGAPSVGSNLPGGVLNPGGQPPNAPGGIQPPTNATGPNGTSPEAQGDIRMAQNARLTADSLTNSIIVVGDAASQKIFKKLIEFLDKRRPQVMIECRVVVVDTSDNYSVGVELSAGDRTGAERLIQFTSFGLSTVDAATGALSLIPGAGLNASLFSPEDGDAVLRALAVHSRARVLSVPRILVDDNSTGSLASVSEVPFTSVNASNTVATTSFAGFAEAGTNIEVTPRISENDYLSLDYVVTVNSFTGTGGDGVPPPRQTDEVRSTVTIPDGHTVIVGGLNQQTAGIDVDGVPILEHIPLLRRLTSLENTSQNQTTLYVFLKPIILRDDKFRDLKYLSEANIRCADTCPDHPTSKPMLIR